jgi:anti-anti-sigma regulatory factor
MNKNNKENKITLNLEGQLTIQRAEEIKNNLLGSYANVSEIEVNIEKAESFDLSFLQLLYYAEEFLKRKGVTLTLEAGSNTDFSETVYKAGLENQLAFFTEKKNFKRAGI